MTFSTHRLVTECLQQQLSEAKIGIVVQGLVELQPDDIASITQHLSETYTTKLYVAAVGYERILVNGSVEIAYTVEKAVEWRNANDKAGRIIVFYQTKRQRCIP